MEEKDQAVWKPEDLYVEALEQTEKNLSIWRRIPLKMDLTHFVQGSVSNNLSFGSSYPKTTIL